MSPVVDTPVAGEMGERSEWRAQWNGDHSQRGSPQLARGTTGSCAGRGIGWGVGEREAEGAMGEGSTRSYVDPRKSGAPSAMQLLSRCSSSLYRMGLCSLPVPAPHAREASMLGFRYAMAL